MGDLWWNERHEGATGLKLDDFEALKIYKLYGSVHSTVNATLKRVFERLFQGTGIDSNEFHFVCVHDEEPNAFYIDKGKIKNEYGHPAGRNIVAVSDALIAKLDCEDELRQGIICGIGLLVAKIRYTKRDGRMLILWI